MVGELLVPSHAPKWSFQNVPVAIALLTVTHTVKTTSELVPVEEKFT